MFIIGNAGSAKTTIWIILSNALNHLGQKIFMNFPIKKSSNIK